MTCILCCKKYEYNENGVMCCPDHQGWTPSRELLATMASRVFSHFANKTDWKAASECSVKAAKEICRLIAEDKG